MAVRETPLRPVLQTAVGDPVLVGAGNIASCTSGGDETTAALLDVIPGTVFTAGDNVYEKGTAEEFLDCYAPSWGRHRARTRPVPGDHDHGTAGASPYFTYFDTLAGPSGRGYYSYDVGSWHLIALDSSIPSGPSSAQYRWLQADLKAHLTACTIAIWHHPLFSSGLNGNSTTMKAIWKALDDAGADLVVNGHDHNYERFAPQNFNGVANSDGVRAFIVGTGGESLRSFGVIRPNSEVRYNGSVGVLKLTLHPRSYAWEFVTDPAATFTDTGMAACVQMPANQPPVALASGPYAGDEGGTGIVFDGSGSSDPENEVLTYAWDFGDGSTGQGVTPRHAYADNGSYAVTLVVTDPGGLADTAAATATIANVAPMATFSAPATVPVDSAYGLSLDDPADVSSTDFLAGFSYAFDCGTGYGEWSVVSSTTCPGVAVAGPRTVKGQIRDKDIGVSEYTATIDIEAPDPDPNAPPVASAGDPYAGDEGGTGIVFDGSGSSDPEDEVLTYAWDFGDGSTGQGVTPRHAYADNGSYAVTLVVTDPGGLADTAAATATIANVAPMATFSAPATVPVDSAYGLSLDDPADVSSTDFLAGFSYAFDCGTGYGEWSPVSSTTCPGVSVAGPRTVKGQIRDKDTGVSEYTATIDIEAPDPDPNAPPVASAGGPYAGDEGGTGTVFDGSGSSDPENEVLTYAWDFGDGATGQGVSPRHAYADNGSYAVTLIVTDPEGLADTAAATATIANVAPMATFNAPATVPVDSAYSLSLDDPADVSSTDFLAGFSYAFDCGTGYGEWSPVSSTTCPGVSVAGPRTVKGQIRDKDTGVSEYTATIDIEAPDPVPPPTGADSFPVPIMDGDGLYGGGSNTPPQFHRDAGLQASAMVPDRRAVMVSLGMSITQSAFGWWIANANSDAVLVPGACGGCSVDSWTSLEAAGWQNAFWQLHKRHLAAEDVSAVWMSVTRSQTEPATAADLETILLRIREAYPNVRQVFVTNRTYGGYRTAGSAEPGAWQDGIAVREFVLNHLGETEPWIGWAGDLWANGDSPRLDGLQWILSDFVPDGLHYTAQGRAKVGALARDQFVASPFTDWYQP